MPPQTGINALLRFLTQDAKLPLPSALAAARPLQSKSLATAPLIAASNVEVLNTIFSSQEDTKKVMNAAKRTSKRTADHFQSSPRKKQRVSQGGPHAPEPQEVEASLALPTPVTDLQAISNTVLITNRAPLLLVFCVTLLGYTMPRQPLSSQLSLAQAQVSQGARERAKNLGIEKGQRASEEGWGTGQPIVKVMNKDVYVVRRPGYPLANSETLAAGTVDTEIKGTSTAPSTQDVQDQTSAASVPGAGHQEVPTAASQEDEIALWALDLEALKKSNTASVLSSTTTSSGGLPIYSPQSARSYIMKAFASAPAEHDIETKAETSDDKKTKKGKRETKEKEENLGLLLGALKLLFDSWSETLDSDDLSRRAWTWYVKVRPEVEHGAAGWGGKGEVKLQTILDLRR